MYQKALLGNGLRLATEQMPHTRSVCITIFVGAGSRYEQDQEAGVSHFIEHLLFKGTEKRRSAKEISEAIERVGGLLNAGTDRELTVYWCKVARPHFPLALDLLVDMLLHSRFEPEDVEKERQIIIEELNTTRDAPQQWVDILIDEVVWPDQPLGRDVAGSKETVSQLSREMALAYFANHYSPANTVVSVAGDIEHEEVLEHLDRALGSWHGDAPGTWFPAQDGQEAPRIHLEPKRTEQAHLCLAVRGVPNQHPDRFTLDLLNCVLGEGMSSRLFLEIREKRGLAYDVHSYVSHFRDSGSATVYAGVEPRHIYDTIQAILEEMSRLKEEITEEELEKAREFSKGRMLLRMEDSRSVAGWLGAQELLTGHIRTVDEVLSIVDAITPEDLSRVAQRLFRTEKLNLAVVGPFRSEGRFASLLKL